MSLYQFELKGVDNATRDFYRASLRILQRAQVPVMIGGAYAFACYTGIVRHTKDLDLFTTPALAERAMRAFREAGYRTELTSEVWLGKAFHSETEDFVDVIFRSGNAVSEIETDWFEAAEESTMLGVPVRICPAEELLWMKAFLMERERFDGADVAHLLLCRASVFDWDRLIRRFGPYRRVLLAHLLLFGFIYPDQADVIPEGVMESLWRAARNEPQHPGLCRGPLLSRAAYLLDVEGWGFRDARFTSPTRLSAETLRRWQAVIESEHQRDLKACAIAMEDSSPRPRFAVIRRSA